MEPSDGLTVDEVELGIRSVIITHGWAGMAIFDPDAHRKSWFYTVGFSEWGHPEVVIFDLPPQVAHGIAQTMAESIRMGVTYHPDNTYYDVLSDGLPVAIVKVDDPFNDEYPLAMSRRLYGQSIEAIQVVWPGEDHLFPWSGTTNPRCRDQRLFGTWRGE